MKGHQNTQTLKTLADIYHSYFRLLFTCFFLARDTSWKEISFTSYHTRENNKDLISCAGAALGFDCKVFD